MMSHTGTSALRARILSVTAGAALFVLSLSIGGEAGAVEIVGDQTIEGHVKWNGDDTFVHGSVVIEPGGRLEVGTTGRNRLCEIYGGVTVRPGGRLDIGYKPLRGNCNLVCRVFGDIELQGSAEAGRGKLGLVNATLEVVGRFQNEFIYRFAGGELATSRGARIGGASRDGRAYTSGFDLADGRWLCRKTTVQYISGIWISGGGSLDAKGIVQGDIPDAIHLTSGAQAVVRKSTYDVLVTLSFLEGGSASLALPTNRRIRYWDSSGLPGADYSLRLYDSTVPLWWLNVIVASKGAAPDGSIFLEDCPNLGMHLEGPDLRNDPSNPDDFRLPVTWTGDPREGEVEGEAPWIGQVPAGTEWDTGNVHWTAGGRGAGIGTWGVYPVGSTTDLVLRGPTKIAELIFSKGSVTMLGTPGRHDAIAAGWFFEAGTRDGSASPRATLILENVSMGIFDPDMRYWPGQFVAYDGGEVRLRETRVGIATVRTGGSGQVWSEGDVCVMDEADYEEDPAGGPIRVERHPC